MEELKSIASKVFTDEHYGASMTKEEILKTELLENEYKDEIAFAKLMLENNPNFKRLPFEKKVEVAAKLIFDLKQKRKTNDSDNKKIN